MYNGNKLFFKHSIQKSRTNQLKTLEKLCNSFKRVEKCEYKNIGIYLRFCPMSVYGVDWQFDVLHFASVGDGRQFDYCM